MMVFEGTLTIPTVGDRDPAWPHMFYTSIVPTVLESKVVQDVYHQE